MDIKNYISKDLVIGAIGGSILATIITSIIDTKAVNKSNEELKLSNEKLEEVLERLEEGDEVLATATHQLKVSNEALRTSIEEREKLKEELAKYKTKEVLEEREKIKKEEVKKAIKKKDWTTVYNKAEGWYNKYPVQMGRYEVFRYLKEDGYVTDEEVSEARDYFGNLWDYVGD